MPPMLCWSTTSEADVGALAVEAEPSHQYSVRFCCYVTDGSRRAIWQNGVWPGNVYEAKVWNWIPLCRKNGTHWHSLMLAECFWRPNSRREHSEAVGGVFQQWQQWHERQAMFWMVMHSCQTMIWSIYLSTNCWFTTGNCIQSWISAILCWKEMMVAMLEYQSLHKVGPLNSHTGTERTIYASLSGSIKSIWGWSSFLNRIITIYEMWYHHHKLKSKWQYMKWQHMNSPSKKKMQPQWVKRWALSFRTGN